MKRNFKNNLWLWLGAVLLIFVATETKAADSGFYIGAEVGISESSNLDTSLHGINHPTRCDVLLYSDPSSAPTTDPECTNNTPAELFNNSFDPDTGFVGGVSVGYMFGRFRLEAEYLNRHQGRDERLLRTLSGNNQALLDKDSEWSIEDPPRERISDFNAHHFFLNAYYDFRNSSAWTPYFGAGVGVGKIEMRYGNHFLRKNDLGTEEWQQNAAGTISYLDTKLEGTRLGFQVIGGVDYALSEQVSIGTKVRWTRFDGFTEEDRLWGRIRSHDPVLADGTTPFTSDVKLDNLDHWTMTVGLKYHF